jgi:NAD(P)-dependent dehydrogenase (short-subunit alcohol dehydrogenase family)
MSAVSENDRGKVRTQTLHFSRYVRAGPGQSSRMPSALVIGNSDGIGLALTKLLLAKGWHVRGVSRSASSPLHGVRDRSRAPRSTLHREAAYARQLSQAWWRRHFFVRLGVG